MFFPMSPNGTQQVLIPRHVTRIHDLHQGTVCSAFVLERIKRTLHYSSQTTTARTAMLWLQYLKMVAILHIFISKLNGWATGNALHDMLPCLQHLGTHTHDMQRLYTDTNKRCFFWQKLIQMPIGHSWNDTMCCDALTSFRQDCTHT